MIRSTACLRRSVVKSSAVVLSTVSHQSCAQIPHQNFSTAPDHNNSKHLDAIFASDLVRPHDEFVHKHHAASLVEEQTTDTITTAIPSLALDTPRTSVLMELTDRVGVLHDVLKFYWKYDVNITRIESRPHKMDPSSGNVVFDFFLDLYVATEVRTNVVVRLFNANHPFLFVILVKERGATTM